MLKTKFENKSLLELFPEVSLNNEASFDDFSKINVVSINVYRKSRKIEIFLESEKLIKSPHFDTLKANLQRTFSLNDVIIKMKFNINLDINEIIEKYWEDIIFIINKKMAVCRGIMFKCTTKVEHNKLKIFLNKGGSRILKLKACDFLIETLIFDMFSVPIKVEFIDLNREIDIKNNIEEQKFIEIPAAINKPADTKNNQKTADKKTPNKNYQKRASKSSDILGKVFTESSLALKDVTQDVGTIAVAGEIIRVEYRETLSGKILFMFDITDHTSSITVKFFINELTDNIKEKLREGECVKIRGDAQFDKYQKETTIFAIDIMSMPKIPQRTDTSEEKRVELHLHTQMSSMDGVSSVKEIVKRAISWGHEAVAITDHGVLQAFPDANDAAKDKIKIIYGVECYLFDDEGFNYQNQDDFDDLSKEKFKKIPTNHAIILVENYQGLKNLYKLVSYSHLKYFYKRPRIPKSILLKYREGLIIGSACEAGELYTALLNNKSKQEIEKIIEFYDYLEIQPLGNNKFLIENEKVQNEEALKEINKNIVALAKQYNKLAVATCDVHFLDPKDEVFRRILMAGKGFADADNQAPLFFRTTDEMLREFDYLGNDTYDVVVKNTKLIADRVSKILPIPDGTFPPNIEGAEREIKSLSERATKKTYGDNLPAVVNERLTKELNSIIKNGFSVMYMIARKLVLKSLDDGYLVGSRGSVGSSFIANMVGITEVNSLPPHYVCENCTYSEFITDGSIGCGFDLPRKYCPICKVELKKDGYDIPFETFLGFDGDKEPDIDLNFSGEYQSIAHKYTEELFGEGHVFRAGTIATIADKTAYGFIKNYLDERNVITSNAEINRLVKGCTGVKRTTGQHPGGVMIVPKDKEIFDFCPIQRPADDAESNIITTHFDYHSISGRLLKLDILGHDDPTVIRMLEDLTGVDARTIPIGEEKTMAIFSSTEPLGIKPEDIDSEVGTFGIPEFGTKFVRQMLIDTKPKTFSELIRISGLSHGTDVWINNAQELIKNKTATLSEVICTRDDIMLYLIYSGLLPKTAFKIMEDVRKGKGVSSEFEKIMIENNVPTWYIESCKKIKYMFPKAHAAAYVMMAFRIAWFKVYHPESFYVTYFTVRADDFDADLMVKGQDFVKRKIKEFEQKGNNITQKEKNVLTILEVSHEMYARGIKFLPVDIYESDAVNFKITECGIRPPLNSLQGLGITAAKNIAMAREGKRFLSIEDLRISAKISKAVIEILENHGCLKGMAESSQMSIFDVM